MLCAVNMPHLKKKTESVQQKFYAFQIAIIYACYVTLKKVNLKNKKVKKKNENSLHLCI